MPENEHNNHHHHADEGMSGGGRKIEKEKWALLGLALIIAGAVVLGVLTHAEGIEVRSAMKDIKIIIDEEFPEFGDS